MPTSIIYKIPTQLVLPDLSASLGLGVLTYDGSGEVNSRTYADLATTLGIGAASLVVGTSTITSGTTTRILYDNAGVLGEYTISGTGTVVVMQTTPTIATPSFTTGFTIGGAAASGKFIVGNGTNYIASTSTIPTSAGATANKVLLSDGTNYVLSTPTFPNASATSGKIIISDGTNWIASTPTHPTSATLNKVVYGDGTNWVLSTPTIPMNASPGSGKILIGDGTNYVLSTPTFPNASATTRKIIVSDGTNWTASTETYAVPGTSGNVLTSNGTNWVSSAPATSGTVTSVSFTGGLISVATATTTPALTVAGTSGGIPYFSSISTWASSAALAANALVIGGGAGVAPSTTTTGTGILTWLGTPSSANLRAALTDENGTGVALFDAATTPTFTTGNSIGGAATTRKILVGDGTNFIPSTETWAVPGTSGNILVSDGTNWTSAVRGLTVGTTTITSGTNKAIPFNDSGVYNEDATVFVWDKTNNRLGVGTNAPSYDIHVKTSASPTIQVEGTTTTSTPLLASVNSIGDFGWFSMYGSAASIAPFTGQLGIGSSKGFVFYSNGSVVNGGTDVQKFLVGGYDTTQERMRIAPTGVSFGTVANATALVHIAAGTATANTAPIKLTSGTVNTTAVAGQIEYNNSFYQTKNSGLRHGTGGVIKTHYADGANSGTGETDLYTYTTPASTLATDGESITFEYTVNLSDITSTATIKVYFAGTAIANTGALTVSATGAVRVQGSIIRTSSTTVRTSVNIASPTASTATYTAQSDMTGLTLSNTNIIKITGTAGGAGGGSGDITAKSGIIWWWPVDAN